MADQKPTNPAPVIEKLEAQKKTSNTIALVFGALFAISEVLAQIPSVQSSSVFQLVYNFLKSLSGN